MRRVGLICLGVVRAAGPSLLPRTRRVMPLMLLCAWPSIASAQESGKVQIGGFASLDWGADERSVKAQWGEPATVSEDPLGKVMRYMGQVVGRVDDAQMVFLVHPKSGLIQGEYVFWGEVEHANRVFEEWGYAVAGTYAGLSPIRNCPGEPGCSIGNYDRQIQWIGPGGGILLTLKDRKQTVTLSYESVEFDKLLEERGRRRF